VGQRPLFFVVPSSPHLAGVPKFTRSASQQLLASWQFWIALTAALSAVCCSLASNEKVLCSSCGSVTRL